MRGELIANAGGVPRRGWAHMGGEKFMWAEKVIGWDWRRRDLLAWVDLCA